MQRICLICVVIARRSKNSLQHREKKIWCEFVFYQIFIGFWLIFIVFYEVSHQSFMLHGEKPGACIFFKKKQKKKTKKETKLYETMHIYVPDCIGFKMKMRCMRSNKHNRPTTTTTTTISNKDVCAHRKNDDDMSILFLFVSFLSSSNVVVLFISLREANSIYTMSASCQ